MFHWLFANDGAHAGWIYVGGIAVFMVATVLYYFVFQKKTPTK